MRILLEKNCVCMCMNMNINENKYLVLRKKKGSIDFSFN